MCKQHEEKLKALHERLSYLFMQDARYSRGYNDLGEQENIEHPDIYQSIASDWAELIGMITPEVIDEVVDKTEA